MIHNKTWKSHDDQTENEIDFICVSNKLSYVIQNSRNYKGVDISSDHQLFRSVLKIKAGTVLTKSGNKYRKTMSSIQTNCTRSDRRKHW